MKLEISDDDLKTFTENLEQQVRRVFENIVPPEKQSGVESIMNLASLLGEISFLENDVNNSFLSRMLSLAEIMKETCWQKLTKEDKRIRSSLQEEAEINSRFLNSAKQRLEKMREYIDRYNPFSIRNGERGEWIYSDFTAESEHSIEKIIAEIRLISIMYESAVDAVRRISVIRKYSLEEDWSISFDIGETIEMFREIQKNMFNITRSCFLSIYN